MHLSAEAHRYGRMISRSTRVRTLYEYQGRTRSCSLILRQSLSVIVDHDRQREIKDVDQGCDMQN